jgi:hypothetical protein
MSHTDGGSSRVIFLPPGEGRSYQAGPMRAVFKADGAETEDRYRQQCAAQPDAHARISAPISNSATDASL